MDRDTKKEAFLARLRETFRVEAAEHLEAIDAGLVGIERVTEAERAPLVERIFREAHSLKGAARSAGFTKVEALCVELESLFAALKRGELVLSSSALDAVLPALRLLGTLCSSPDAAPASATEEQERHALELLRQVVRGDREASRRSVASDPVAKPAELPPVPPPPDAAPGATPDKVRISTQKLSALVLEAEELVGAKLAANGHAAELRALVVDLSRRNQRRGRLAGRLRGDGAGATSASELFEAEVLYSRALESSLRKLAGSIHQDALSLAVITDRLLEDTKNVLLLPCSYLLGVLQTVARDLARDQGKEADLFVRGEDIEIDRRILDELKDPLFHLLRNCIDHGLEKPDVRRERGKPTRGSITITVRTIEGGRVELAVADDGAGIDAREVRAAARRLGLVAADEAAGLTETETTGLIFRSGLSTSPILTDLSGRGLGLAIVREKVEALGGAVTVSSEPGIGTSFRMIVPSSLATFRGVFVEVAGRRFVFPSANISRVGRVRPDEIETVENRQTVSLDGQAVSLVRLRDVLELTEPDGRTNGATRPVVIVRTGTARIAFLVDKIQGEQEVMVRSLGPQLPRVRNIGGAAISGAGAVVPILNVADLVESARNAGAPEPLAADHAAAPLQRRRLLIAEDSITARTLVKSILEGAGYEVVATVDGLDALTRLKSEPFDLLVSDVDMPRLNGFELTSRIRADKKLNELPVVLVTALASQEDREYGIEVGANAYIVKSDFDQGNLLEIIARLL